MLAAKPRDAVRAAALSSLLIVALALPACSAIARHLLHSSKPDPATLARVEQDFGNPAIPPGYHVLKAQLASQNTDHIEKLDIVPDGDSRIFVIVLTFRTFVVSTPFDYGAAYGAGACTPTGQTIDTTFEGRPVTFAPKTCTLHSGKVDLAAGQNLPFKSGTIIVVAQGPSADFDPGALRATIASIH